MSDKSWLRREAEKVSRKTYPMDTYDRSATFDLSQGEALTLRIERVAKQFAERALREIMGCTEILPSKYDLRIAEAIRAAEEE